MNAPQIENTSGTTTQSLFASSQWNEIKSDIITLWSSVNHDELDHTRGNIKEIANLIHNKYGAAKKAVTQQVTAVYQKYQSAAPPGAFSSPGRR